MSLISKKSRALACLFALPFLLQSSMILADDEDVDEKKNQQAAESGAGGEAQTATIMVTASRVEADLFELPMTVNVITEEDIRRNPVTNITDILATVPGLNVVDAGMGGTVGGGLAGAKRVSIRGEDVSRTLILINGIRTVDKRAGQTGVMIDASQIERIEVIKGPASVLYGPEAIGGVINIITKKGGEKPVGFSQNFVIDTSTESVDIQSAVFGNINGFNYRFSGSGVNVHERKVPGADNSTSDRSSYKNRYYSGQLGYDWDKGSFSLRADQYESEIEYALGRAMSDSATYMEIPENDRKSLAGTLELKDLASFLPKLTLTGSYQNSKRDMVSDFASMMGAVYHNKSDQDQYGFSGVSEWTLGKHYLTAGWDYEFDDVYVEVINDLNLAAGSNATVEQSTLGIFAQDEWSFVDDFKLILGARQTWIESKFIDKEGRSFDIPPKKNRKHDSLVGNVGLVYSGLEDLALRINWSQGNKYPTVQQLFTGSAGHGTGPVVNKPNPDLDPERSNSYEIGARYRGGGWDIDAALFYTEAKDYINTYTCGANLNCYENAAKAETFGAELGLSYIFESTGLKPYTTASWLQRETTSRTGFKTDKNRIPDFEGRIGLKWSLDVNDSQTVFTDLYCNWASKAQQATQNATTRVVTTTEYPAWQTLNLTLGIEGGEEHKYNASLSLKNIGNQHYVTSRGSANLPEPGFHVVLGLGFEY